MTFKTTPNGTYGAGFPVPPRWMRPLMKPLMALGAMMMARRGMRLLVLTTTGARSGREHEVHLGWFPDGQGGWLIVASAAGAARNPAWYYNLAHNPDKVWITLEGRKIKVRPSQLQGEERSREFDKIVAVAPGYGEYVTKTDRELPVIRLVADATA